MKTRKRTSLQNCDGMSLTESLVGVALLGIVFSGTAMLSQNLSSMKEKVLQNKSTIYISNSLRMVLENPEAWKNTILESENEILDCLRKQKTCGRQNEKNDRQVRYVRLASNDIFFKSNTHGFTLNGERCTLSDPSCAVKPSIFATFICNKSISTDYPISSNCLSPQIELSVKFDKNPHSDIDGNFSQFNFNLIKNTEPTPCTFGCREATYSWDNDANLKRPQLKLVMIIDNSASMNIAQAKLANGFAKMLDELAIMVTKLKTEIEFDIYTTTIWDYNAPRDLSVDGVAYSYNYMDSGGNLHTTATSPSNITHTFDMIQNYYVNWPISISNWDTLPAISNSAAPEEPLILTPAIASDQSADGKFEIFKKKVQTLVSKIGTSGNAREGGLCVLNKVTYNKGDSRIFNPGDKAIFLVMSNENDFSHTEYCHGYKLQPYIADPNGIVGCNPYTEDNCEHIQYSVKISADDLNASGVSNRTPLLNFQCSLGNDNVNLVSASHQYDSWGSCDHGTTSCLNIDKTTADTICKKKSVSGLLVPNTCKRSCAQAPYTCYHKETQDMTGNFCSKLSDSTTSLYKRCIGEKFASVPTNRITCKSFSARAGTMADLTNVKKSSYHLEQPEGFASSGTYDLSEQLSSQGYFGGGTQSFDPVGLRLSASFLKKAEELFGPPGVGFFVSSIIHDTLLDQPYAASCPKPAARTDLFLDPMGARYRELAKSSSGSYQSICATDNYADTLTRATEFSLSTLHRSVTIINDEEMGPVSQLSPMEQIIGVWVNGEEQSIGTEVFVNGPTLQFTKDISKNAEIKVRIERKNANSSNFENVRFANEKEKSEEQEEYLKKLMRKLMVRQTSSKQSE